ncbi:MAG: DUF3306 domain-containing protein [Sedimenticola sp.]|nr:DUF3306 domain-containing protein [Sedimenticola sp.]
MTSHIKMDRDAGGSDSFISRWSRLKQEAALPTESSDSPHEIVPNDDNEIVAEPLCDSDMPPIESLDEHSDYSGFLSEKVSESLRRQALRKLFHSAAFNVCDGLDDYDGDYTNFAGLGDIVTADMRHQLAMAEAKLEAMLVPQTSQQESGESEHTVAVEPAVADADRSPSGSGPEDFVANRESNSVGDGGAVS